MSSLARSVALSGTVTDVNEVHVRIHAGAPETQLRGVSLVDVRSLRDRVRAAVRNGGFSWPGGAVEISCSSAHTQSETDLAIAVAVLAASQAASPQRLVDSVFLGELSLDGTVRSVDQVLPRVRAARDAGYAHALVPTANEAEAATVRGIVIVAVTTLAEVVFWLSDHAHVAPIVGIDETTPDIDEAMPTTHTPSSGRRIRHVPHHDHSFTAVEAKVVPVHAVRQARAYLLRVVSAPTAAVSNFVANVGPVVAAEQIRAKTCPAQVLAAVHLDKPVGIAEDDLARAEQLGARLVIPEDDEWPHNRLGALTVPSASDDMDRIAPPLALWARGSLRLDDLAHRALAVVGSRAATSYGEHHATEVSQALAQGGVTIWTGASYGIEGAAVRGALAVDTPAVAILGCGVDAAYPAGHASLLERIADTGLILSEYAPGVPPARHRLLARNRLLAALTGGLLVVEAGLRSGARSAAATATSIGRPVMALPGPVGSAQSWGCHDLIRSGTATLVTSAEEVLAVLAAA